MKQRATCGASGHPLFAALLRPARGTCGKLLRGRARRARAVLAAGGDGEGWHRAESRGFDLCSRGTNAIRYIEVKGRKGNGAVSLTASEWIKAARFGKDYWLYVVHGCGTDAPRLTIIHDPAA